MTASAGFLNLRAARLGLLRSSARRFLGSRLRLRRRRLASARGSRGRPRAPCRSAAPDAPRAARRSSASQASRASRSSVAARTLISSCALSARSISAITASVRPLSPMMHDGLELVRFARAARCGARRGVGRAWADYRRAMKKSHSSKQWLRRHVEDPYVQRSKREGYRSRAAYKLHEIDERDKLLSPAWWWWTWARRPGGWSQVLGQARGRARARWSRSTCCEMEPIAGVTFIRGDFASPEGLDRGSAGTRTGARPTWSCRTCRPTSPASRSPTRRAPWSSPSSRCDFALKHLQARRGVPGQNLPGCGVRGIPASRCGAAFDKVVVRKPDASRDESAEQYLLARGLRSKP